MIKNFKSSDSSKISTHFKVSEFKCKCGGSHDTKLDTTLVDKLETLYKNLNCSMIVINSGYRCSTHDKNVGGTGWGQHTKGNAADIVCYDQSGNTIDSRIVTCAAQDVGFGGIGRICSNATHVDTRTSNFWKGDETLGAAGTNSSITSDYYSYWGLSKNDVYGSNASSVSTSTTTSTKSETIPSSSSTEKTHSWTYKVSDSIKDVQEILNNAGAKLDVDGKAGNNTFNELCKYTIQMNDQGKLVKWVQERLNKLGYDCGTADGISGSKTMAAIAKFQKANKLGVGYLGGEDWYYLIKD